MDFGGFFNGQNSLAWKWLENISPWNGKNLKRKILTMGAKILTSVCLLFKDNNLHVAAYLWLGQHNSPESRGTLLCILHVPRDAISADLEHPK